MEKLSILQEGKYYTISFDKPDPYSYKKDPNIIEIQVLIKLEKTIKIKISQNNPNGLSYETNPGIKWYECNKDIQIFDEIPMHYFRKEKLKKLKEQENEN